MCFSILKGRYHENEVIFFGLKMFFVGYKMTHDRSKCHRDVDYLVTAWEERNLGLRWSYGWVLVKCLSSLGRR